MLKSQQTSDQLEEVEEESAATETNENSKAAAKAFNLNREAMMQQTCKFSDQANIKDILNQKLQSEHEKQDQQNVQSQKSQAQNKNRRQQKPAQNQKTNQHTDNKYSNKKGNWKPLPIESYPLNKLVVEVHQNEAQNHETLVVLKHTKHQFATRPFESYKDKKSQGAKRAAQNAQQVDQDAVMQETTERQDIAKFTARKYYLFSKYDQGIKIDEEGWYSVTPETMAKYLSDRVKETYGEFQQVNVLDCFVGVGGNLIQFAKMNPESFCVGVDFDPIKVEYTKHNAQVYGLKEHSQFQVVNSDFLQLQAYDQLHLYDDESQSTDQFQFPNQHKQFDAAFISPPWGGNGYDNLQEYSLDFIYPQFSSIIDKVTQYTSNLMIFLPRNTSIKDVIKQLLPFSDRLFGQQDHQSASNISGNNFGENRAHYELNIEVQELIFGNSVKAIVVYTGDLAHIHNWEVAQYFIDNVCLKYKGHETNDYLRSILQNIFNLCGYEHFIKHFKNERKLSLPKIIKQIQSKFTQEEWYFLRKIHKKANNFFLNQGGEFGESGQGWVDESSKKSSTISQISIEEYKSNASSINHNTRTTSISDGTSHRSRKNSSSSFSTSRQGAARYKKRSNKNSSNLSAVASIPVAQADTEMIDEVNDDASDSPVADSHQSFTEMSQSPKRQNKKHVHFEQTIQSRGHIELKDLSRQDFEELIGAKNQDSRFYGWLNFQPLIQEPVDEVEHTAQWDKEIEWFKELQDLFIEPDDDYQKDFEMQQQTR